MQHRSLIRILSIGLTAITAAAMLAGPFANVAFADIPPNNPATPPVGGLPVTVGGSAVDAANNAYKNILTEITRTLVVALFNALQVFLGQMAYDAANYVASGGKGQAALFFKKGWGNYMQDVASNAVGEFVGSLSSERGSSGGANFFSTLGYDLCQPTDPRKLLNLQLSLSNFFPGLQSKFDRPKPKCDFQQVVKNYQQLYSTMSNTEVWDNVGKGLSTNSSELGTTAKIGNLFSISIAGQLDAQKLARQEGNGIKPVENIITGNVKTPSQVVKEGINKQVVNGPAESQLAMTTTMLNQAFQSGPIQLAKYTASIFLNTLMSKMLKRIFDKGLDAFDFSDLEGPMPAAAGADSVVTAGKLDARAANIDLRTPSLQTTGEYDVLPELAACPEPRGLWNCTIDQTFITAIQSQGDRGGITIGEALNRDFLHKNWKLIPSDANHTKETQDKNCYLKAYCAANLQKLRINRILPVGFEFAANSPENRALCGAASDGCVDLDTVVRGFSSCNDQGERDAAHPWCHLIDPNWVITVPAQQCVLQGYGEDLLSANLDQRKQDCRDIQTCLSSDNNGNCTGGYGYCVAERSTYRFSADACPQEEASCRNFSTRQHQSVSYLRNTVDYGNCGDNPNESVGCLWYATERTSDGRAWDAGVTTGTRVYFNKNLETCDAGNEG
ncbi:MAG TPA: hypothetical protein VFQ60_00005, partial [Patescibacteria group bacterium]|nr:hypothetical protein [Patescibacteria group bacterium]